MKWTRFRLAAVAVIVAVVACESSPFEPEGLGERVPLNQKVTDEVGGDTVARYSFVGRDSGLYAVFFEAVEGSAFLFVSDSTNPSRAFGLAGGAGSPPFSENVTPIFSSSAGTVFNIRITAVPGTAHARFTFLVYPVDRRPERHFARFGLGDTVAGETIDPIVDIDEFVVHGVAGQEIVAVGETQGPAGSGSVALNVIDPVTPTLLGYVFADAGTPTLTTNRIRFPATHDYQFFFGSVTSNVYPRYSGPYRFWTYLINRAPEHGAPTAPFNTEVSSERLDRAGDVDEFTFAAAANSDFNVFLQSSRPCQLEIAPPTEGAYTVVAPNDTALFAHGTGRFHIAQAGTYTIRFSGTENRIADTGSYRWYLYAIDPRPEHVPAAVTPGDTVSGEDIALPGDIDEFTFTGAVGQEYNVFFQAQSGSSDTRLQLQVLNSAGQLVATAQSGGGDTDLMGQVTGRFSLVTPGTYRIRVSGVGSTATNDDHGPYRFFVYPIDRRPETLSQNIALGDSLTGEAIDAPGDIDEFKITVPATTGANLVVEYDGSTSPYGWLTALLIDSASGQPVAGISEATPGVRVPTGRVTLHPGRYIVRIEGYQTQSRSTERGPYRFWLYSFGLGPEAVADTFAVGDTVGGESIAPWGDADVFHFHGNRGQHLNLKFQGLGVSSSAEFVASLTLPGPPDGYPNAAVYSPTAATALDDHQTMRLELPATGWYNLFVSGVGGIDAQGPYRFVIETEDSLPEQVSAALVPGDSVMTESIDRPGDWDQFSVTATAGQELGLVYDGRYAYSGDFAYIRAIDPNTGDTLTGTVGQFKKFTGPFRVPAGGRVNVAVFEPGGFYRTCGDATCGGAYGLTGLYGLHVVAVNRTPEVAARAYVVGDTISNEAIDYIGDIDEFTVSGTPGDTLHAFFRMLVAPTLNETSHGLSIEMFDPAAGDPPRSNAAYFGTSPLYPVGSFVVPPSGSFVIRFRGTGFWGEDITTGPYQFLITR